MATYKELKYEYSLDDFLDLYEICMIQLYNKNASLEKMKEVKNK